MGASASSPDPPPPEASRKKKAPLSTLRKRLARRRWRASKGLDHAQVFHDFLVGSGCTLPEVAALVHEYEATSALRELSLQADVARPAARSCRADLGRLLESRLCADVTLAYRGTGFPAHRAILSARCPFFRDLLSAPRQQMMVLEMDIPGVGVDLFGDLLHYLYTGELSVAGDSTGALSTVLRLSEQFGVPNPLAHDLRRLLEGGHLADACLVWDVPGAEQEAEFPCHRAILAARSPFFRGVVQRRGAVVQGAPSRMRVVLDGAVVPLRHARVVLWSLYQDSVDLSSLACGPSGACGGGSFPEELMELYEVARLLEMDSLAQGCEDALVELLSPETLAGVLQWSDQPHGSPWVHRQAMGFLAEEFSALAASPLLYQLSKTQLLQLLQSDFLQASELEILVSVLKWGEHQLLKTMEEREPNVVSQTAHSVSRRGARGRRDLLSDTELRELLSELLCHVRTAHVLPPSAEALVTAHRRGLLPKPPPCMLEGEAPPSRGGALSAWLGGGRGLHARPRLFAPYVEEAKAWLEEQLSQEQGPSSQGGSVQGLSSPWQHLSNIPDMVPTFRGSCPSLAQMGHAARTLPALSEEVVQQMRQREQELRQGPLASRAYSLLANRCDVSRQLQLRVVREMGLPDQAAALLCQPPAEDRPPSREGLRTSRPLPASRRSLDHHLRPHLGRRALRLAESGEKSLSQMIPDIAMATATLEHLDLADDLGCEDISPVHMLV